MIKEYFQKRKYRHKIIRHLLYALIPLFAMMGPAQAEEPPVDKFRLAIGGYAIARYDSNISMSDPDLGTGISINPQDTLGIDTENTVLRIEGYYRFRPKHALTYSWYSINSTGSKTIDEEISWIDPDGNPITIPVGAQVNSILDYDIFKVGYLWSFHHSDKVELGVGAGLHITRLTMALDASTLSKDALQNVNTTVPLPVLSFVLNYNVTPTFGWYLKTEAFALNFDNWSGTYRDTTLGMEYRAWKHVALGAGLSSNALDLDEQGSNYHLRFNNTISGGLIYVATYF
jgi:hypothetical protein